MISFPYPGGKAKIRESLYPYFPEEGDRYIEPFVGRGNVFFPFYDRASYSQFVLNDLQTMPFFRAIKTMDVEKLPSSVPSEEFDVWVSRALALDPVALAIEPFITYRSKGYAAGYKPGRYHRHRLVPIYTQAQRILRDPRVLLRQRDYAHLPWGDYTEDDFVYLDPPYYETGGVNLGSINHEELLNILVDTKARWALSGYLSDLYLVWLGDPELKLTRNLEMSEARGGTAVECLWVSSNV